MADHENFSVVDCGAGDYDYRVCSMRKGRSKFSYFFKRKNDLKLLFIAIVYVTFVGFTLVHRAYRSSTDDADVSSNTKDVNSGRYKRDITLFDDNFTLESGQFNASGAILGDEDDNDTDDCYPRSAEEFPGNFLTRKETREGGLFAHILIILYLFGALAIVCDDYFCASLEIICDELKLKEDVAGATFMAAGSSAPEFFTAVIGVFIAKSDVGLGTIVGSAVFNILFIIGVCGVFAGMIVKLTWYPVLRDTLYYLLSVTVLIIVIQDGNVHWYEALILVVLYLLYIVVMYFNQNIEEYLTALYVKVIKPKKHKNKYKEENHNKPKDSEKPLYDEAFRNGTAENDETTFTENDDNGDDNEDDDEDDEECHPPEGHKDSKDYESPWTVPDTFLKRVYWVAMIPMHGLFFVSIPDCRRPGKWHKTYIVTFIMSIAWIAGLSYIMVWMVAVAGDALDIPDTVMGLTLLAAGTSVPDCLASLFVARDGLGDMAVSNSVGSNVFDILMCLGLPWLIETAAVNNDRPLKIKSEGLTYSAITLLSTVVFLMVALIITRWRINKVLGAIFLFVYVIVIVFSCLYETNVIGDFNLKPCPREE